MVAIPRVRFALLAAVVASAAASAGTGFAEEQPAFDDAAKAIQGKWTRVQQTADGPVRLLKEHRGNKTSLAAYDAKGNVLYAHESEFKLEMTGRIRVLTFFNRKVTAGPDKGQESQEESSFVYRVHNGEFIEAWGLLENDPSPPRMILWKRPDNRPLGNEAAVRDRSTTPRAASI